MPDTITAVAGQETVLAKAEAEEFRGKALAALVSRGTDVRELTWAGGRIPMLNGYVPVGLMRKMAQVGIGTTDDGFIVLQTQFDGGSALLRYYDGQAFLSPRTEGDAKAWNRTLEALGL